MPRNRYLLWKKEKKKVESTLNQLEGLKADTAAYVKKLDGSLSSLAEELEQLGNRITLKEEEIDQAQIQLEEARREEEHQYDSMKLRIKYMYENGQNNLLDMVMESGSISELLNRAEYVSQIAEYDRKMLTAYASAARWLSGTEPGEGTWRAFSASGVHPGQTGFHAAADGFRRRSWIPIIQDCHGPG